MEKSFKQKKNNFNLIGTSCTHTQDELRSSKSSASPVHDEFIGLAINRDLHAIIKRDIIG